MDLLHEDTLGFDLTTFGLGIGSKKGVMSFKTRSKIVLSGMSEVIKIHKELDLEYKIFKNDSQTANKDEIILESYGDAVSLHKAWKISQNILEYMSGIATYTNRLLELSRPHNPNISVLVTRKNFPGCKKLMLDAVMCGGGAPHRMGTYDSILIFKQHLEFLKDTKTLEESFLRLKHRLIEKKIIVEVESYEEARYFAMLGADVLQCEKMDLKVLRKCAELKKEFSNLTIAATGGINESNIAEFAQCGVDAIVTSSPYHAKPADIKVSMREAG